MTPQEKVDQLLEWFGTDFRVTSIVTEIIFEIKHNIKCDWIEERRYSEETLVYWNEVRDILGKM